jgi:hypothetical protein
MVYKADQSLGMMREPMVSVPMAMGENPAATPTADPEEDPPGFWKTCQLQDNPLAEVVL